LDFGRYIAGPFCGSLLGDLGAEVIRIDKNGTNEDRHTLTADHRNGAVFLCANMNKKSIAIDISNSNSYPILQKLIESSDVVIANMPYNYLISLNLDFGSLCKIKPDIIMATIDTFGFGSREVGFDGVAQFVSGAVSVTGFNGNPVKAAVPYNDFGTALSCAYGILAAIIHKQKTGQGQHINCSLVGTNIMMNNFLYVQGEICKLPKTLTGNQGQFNAPSDVFKTIDGWIYIVIVGDLQFKRWLKLIDRLDLIDDERFASDFLRSQHIETLSTLASEWCAKQTTQNAFEQMQRIKIPCGPYATLESAYRCEKFHQAGFFTKFHFPEYEEEICTSANPVKFITLGNNTPIRPPLVGEHTHDILANVGFSIEEITRFELSSLVSVYKPK